MLRVMVCAILIGSIGSTSPAWSRSDNVLPITSLQEALVRLLAGTGLRARFTSGESIVITQTARADMTLDMLNVQAAPIVGNSPPDPRALEIVDGLKQTAACRTPPGMVEVIRRERAGVMTVQTDEAHVLVIAPSVDVEAVRISTEQFSSPIPAGSYQLNYPPHSEVVLIQRARARFQAWLSARFAEPRRLRRTVTILGYAGDMFDVVDLAQDCAKDRAFARNSASQDELCQALVEALNETRPANDVWVTVQTLKRATDYPQQCRDCTPESVADAAGMTLKALHRQAQAVLGTSLSAFIRDVRLTAAVD